MFEDISNREWKFLGIIWMIATIAVFLPSVIGYMNTPSDAVFLARPNNGVDFTVYISQINQAKGGAVFFENLFTLELNSPKFLNPFWLVVGLFANIFDLSGEIAFHGAIFLLIPLFLVTGYRLVCFFFNENNKRRVAFIFFVFASWLGPYMKYLFQVEPWRFPSIGASEAFSFSTLSNSPHFIASTTLLMAIFLFSLYFLESRKIIHTFLAGVCAFLLFSFHPYHIYTVVFVMLVFIAVEGAANRRIDFGYVKHYLFILACSVPPILYYLWTILYVPFYSQIFNFNLLNSAPWIIVADYALLLILFSLGVAFLAEKGSVSRREIFLIVWAVTQFFLLYLPISTQKRLLEGLNVPIIILAVSGLFFLDRLLATGGLKKVCGLFNVGNDMAGKVVPCMFLVISFGLVFSISNVASVQENILFFKDEEHFFGAYIAQDNENAMKWIEAHTPNDSVIFSGYKNGNIIPIISFRHVYLGHYAQTADYPGKEKESVMFFQDYSSPERREFLEKNNIGYIFWGPEERVLTDNFNPDQEDFLQKVYGNGSVAVYRVKMW